MTIEPDWRAEEQLRIRQMLTPADLLSLANGCLGLLAIVVGLNGHVRAAFTLILLAALMDGLDGAVSRLGYGGGRLGPKLDSYADLVSFVLAPALLFFASYRDEILLRGLGPITPLGATSGLVLIVAGFYFCTGLLRLARFDYLAGGERHDYFVGVATPGAAAVVVSITLAHWDLRPALLVVALTALLMTSRVRLPKLRGTMSVAAGLLILAAAWIGDSYNNLGPVLLLVAFLAYLVFGYSYVRRHEEDEDARASW